MSALPPNATTESGAARLIPLSLLFVIGSLLGVFTVLVKAAIGAGWHPVAYLFWALTGSGLILTVIAFATGHRPRGDRRTLQYNLVSGLLSGALPNALSFAAIAHVGASFVALCFAFPPLLSFSMALALGMERYQMLRAIGLLSGLAGVLLIVVEKATVEGDSLLWLGAALAAPVVISLGNIYRSRSWPSGATPLSLAPGMLIAGALLLAPYLLLAGVPLVPPLNTTVIWLVLALVGVFTATFSLIFVLQSLAGPVYLSQIGSVGAVAGAALAVVIYGEPAGITLVAATALILVGAYLVNRTR
ncbi:MAG: DMT family transporter [Hyphomicrobiales bacterium]|nr:DMT family transporter [Hyphomicrobiales bacterium]